MSSQRELLVNALSNQRHTADILQVLFETLDRVILVIDANTRTIRHANQALEAVFGHAPDQAVGRSTRFLHVDEQHYAEFGRLSETVLDRGKTFKTHYQMRRSSGECFPAEITVSAISRSGTWLDGVVSVVRDLSRQRREEELRRRNQERLRLVTEQLPAVLWTTDCSLQLTSILGADSAHFASFPAELVGKSVAEVLAGEESRHEAERTHRQALQGDAAECALKVSGRLYRSRIAALRDPQNAIVGTVGVAHDVTEQERLRAEKLEREKELRCLDDLSEVISDYRSDAAGLLQQAVRLIPVAFQRPHATFCRFCGPSSEYCSESFRRTGSVLARPLRVDDREYGTLEVYLDTAVLSDHDTPFLPQEQKLLDVIGERLERAIEQQQDKQALLESSRKFSAVYESALDPIVIIDDQAHYVEVNQATVNLSGYSREELLAMGPLDIMVADQAEQFQKRWQAFRQRGWSTGEMGVRCRDGKILTLEFHAVADVLPGVHISINRNITERKQRQGQLETALHEREIFLKEIHHRVKNNLQLVSSMLHLQADAVENEEVRKAFLPAQNRVRAIALLYGQLLQSGQMADVQLDSYLRAVTDTLATLNLQVDVRLQAEPVTLHIDRAIPCGLIVNELVTNSIEHAFPGGRDGTVTVGLQRGPEAQLILSVQDNGVGLPQTPLRVGKPSLGLELVNALAAQLGGSVSFAGGAGTRVEIRFQL